VISWPDPIVDRILVPPDGSELSEAILPLVEAHELGGEAELLLLPVGTEALSFSRSDAGPDRAGAIDYLERLAAPLAPQALAVECVALEGLPATVITQHAVHTGADLIAMSTHGRSGVARLLMGSVAEQVLRTTDRPVLLWKAPADGLGP
jgi:nucleotide-binding universal stress UspA family protein